MSEWYNKLLDEGLDSIGQLSDDDSVPQSAFDKTFNVVIATTIIAIIIAFLAEPFFK